MHGENNIFFIIKQIEKPLVLYYVIKNLGSRALKKWGKTLDYVLCLYLHFFRDLAASCALYNRIEHSHDEYMSRDEAKPITFLLPLSLSLIDIFRLHLSSHSEICYFTRFISFDQLVTSCEVSVDYLTGRRKNRPSEIA